MNKKTKTLLFITVFLSVITAFICFPSEPDFIFFNVFGYKYGVNYSNFVILKIACTVSWVLCIYYAYKKDEKH